MKPFFHLLFSLNLIIFSSFSQTDETLILQKINTVFNGMRNHDSSMVKKVFTEDAFFTSVSENEGTTEITNETLKEFLNAVGSNHKKLWDERLYYTNIKIDDDFAMVWADYVFYYGTEMYHCGIDLFQLVKTDTDWKIFQITDTRYKENCNEKISNADSLKKKLNIFLDSWHKNAADADTAFFDKIAPNGIYIGTDVTELWVRDEFFIWAKRFFERKSAWDFKPKSRNIYLNDDMELAWFDEVLDTWMGDCRSSGVLKKYGNEWKIEHYQLSMTVPNEKVQEVIKIIQSTQ